MEKYIYDRGLWYEREGDYYIPCLPPNDPETDPKDNPSSFQTVNTEPQEIGAWGMRHLTYLRNNSPVAYRQFLANGTLNSYLAGVDTSAKEMFSRLINSLVKIHGVTEELKAKDPVEWVRQMNSLRHIAEEIVLSEVIYI